MGRFFYLGLGLMIIEHPIIKHFLLIYCKDGILKFIKNPLTPHAKLISADTAERTCFSYGSFTSI